MRLACPTGILQVLMLGLLGGGVLAPTTAVAQGEASATSARHKVAVIRLEVEGNVPDAARELLGRRLTEGLTAAAFEVTAADSTANSTLGGCRDASCYPKVAQALGVIYLVTGQVQERQKSYDIRLDLMNGRTGAEIGVNRERCEICGIEEAAEKMGLAASALRARLEAHVRTPARFIIRSRPLGARVLIDGRAMGRTPIDATLPGGQHSLSLAVDGYDPLERSFTVVSGVDETLENDLVRLPTKFPFKPAGYVALTVGVLAVAGGVLAILSDSKEVKCDPSMQDPDGDCPKLRATKALGGALLGVGAVSVTLGGVWLYLGSSAGGTVGGTATASVGFKGRF